MLKSLIGRSAGRGVGAVVFTLFGMLIPSIASAQATAQPAPSRLRVGNWTLVPVVQTTGSIRHVHSILALKDKTTAVGDNLVAVWYVRPSSTSAEWAAKTWESVDHWDAIKTVKSETGVSDAWDAFWPTPDSPTYTEPLPAKEYSKGFLATDALGIAINTQAQRDEYVIALTEWGAQTADISFEKVAFDCGGKRLLNVFAETVEAGAASPSMSLDAELGLWNEKMSEECVECAQSAPPATPPGPATIPGTTIPLPSYCKALNTPASWERDSIERDPASDTATSCCYFQRYIFLVECTRSDWNYFLCLGLVTYQRIEYYAVNHPFCCPNPNILPCPGAPVCAPTVPATLPPTGATPTGPKPYYNPE